MVTNNQDVIFNVKTKKYDYENSPFHFSSFVTVYTNPDEYQAYKSDFYATDITKGKIKPQNLPIAMKNRADIFYQCKRPNNTGWGILGATTALVGATALSTLTSDNNN